MALSNSEQKAVAKAIELNGARLVERVQYGTYLVPSATTDESHIVTVQGSDYRCTCLAGQHNRPCWHKAAVLIAKVEHASRARVIGPAPVPAVPAASVPTVTRSAGLKRIALV